MDMYVLIAFGISVLVWSISVFGKRLRLYKRGKRIRGKIIDFRKLEEVILETWSYREKVTLYKPVIEVELNGQKKIFNYEEEIDRRKYEIGDEIDVIYDRRSKEIYMDSRIEFFRFPILLFMLSLMLFSFSLMLFLFKY